MKRNLLLLFTLGFCITSNAQTTWSDQAASVFYNKCSQCHHSAGIAPFSLTDFATAYDNRALIKVAVENNEMPPWPADTSYQRYFHERILTQAERDIIINWVDDDGPSGNLTTAPPPPVYNGSQILPGVPDLVVTMPNYMSKATPSQDDYVCFSMPTGLVADRKIKAIEVIAGNTAIVHHCLVYKDDGTYATDTIGGDCGGPTTGGMIGAYTPGASPTIFPETSTFNAGITLEAGSYIVFAMHYPDGSYGQWDQTKVNIYFYPEPVSNFREVYAAPILSDWTFNIPANTVDSVEANYGPLPATVTMMSVFPHMHLLGKYIESYAVTPTTDTIPFVRIPEWDFHWQEFYFFKYMQMIPINSMIYGKGIYDNTVANDHNPNDPPIDVGAGFNTTDEMFLIYYHFMLYQAGDENINQDSLNTIFLSQGLSDEISYGIKVFPNPSNESVNISYTLNDAAFVSVYIYDINGRLMQILARENQTTGEQKLVWNGTNQNNEKVKSGVYFYSMMIDGVNKTGKIILQR